MPRFVFLEHASPEGVHYDLMLQRGRTLKTWNLENPLAEPGVVQEALERFDHPLRFLTYEGPLSEGKGEVRALDRGDYDSVCWRPGREIYVRLRGGRYSGPLRLSRREGKRWALAFLAEPPPDAGAPGAGPGEGEPPALMRVGEVARRSGLSREVINSYAMFGLIREVERSPSGHRLFGPEVLKRLRMISLLKQRGYTLRDIREIFLKDR